LTESTIGARPCLKAAKQESVLERNAVRAAKTLRAGLTFPEELMSMKNAVLATAVASLFASGAAFAKGKTDKKASSQVMCEGINECKGHGACKSASNACKGQNGCKGQGQTETTAKDCKDKGGKVAVAKK
jgi:hypothetical protein